MISGQRRVTLAVVGIALMGSGVFIVGRLAWADHNASAIADVPSARGVVLRNLAAEAARAADDYDGAARHLSFSFRAEK